MDAVKSRRAIAEPKEMQRKRSLLRRVEPAPSQGIFLAMTIRLLVIAMVFILLAFAPYAARAQGPQEVTQISIGAPAQTNGGALLTAQAVLVDSSGHPISKAIIYFTTQADFLHHSGDVVLAQAVTNKDGQAVAQFPDDFSGTITLHAEFRGDAQYAPSDATTEVTTVNEGQVYDEHVGVDIPGFNVPPRLAPMASVQSPSPIVLFIQNLWPAMNGWPIAAALIVVWSLYLLAVRFVFRIASSKGEDRQMESTFPADERRSS